MTTTSKQVAIRWALRLIGPVALIVLLARARLDEVLRLVAQASLAPFLLGLALMGVVVWLRVLRWRLQLRSLGIEYAWGRAIPAYFGGSYIALLTPGRVGDLVRVQYLRGDVGVPLVRALSTLVMDRLLDLWVLMIFAAVGLSRFAQIFAPWARTLSWMVILATILSPLAILVPSLGEVFMRRILRSFAGGERATEEFFADLRTQLRGLGWTVPLTILSFLPNFAQSWAIAKAFGYQLSWLDHVAIISTTSVLGLLPVSVSGVGVREWFFSTVFPFLGLSKEAGVAHGLAFFALAYLSATIIGFVVWTVAPPKLISSPPKG